MNLENRVKRLEDKIKTPEDIPIIASGATVKELTQNVLNAIRKAQMNNQYFSWIIVFHPPGLDTTPVKKAIKDVLGIEPREII